MTRPAHVRTRRHTGLLLIALAVLCYPAGLAVMKVGLDAGGALRLPAIGLGGFVIGMSWPMLRLGRRLRVTIGDWESLSQDPRPPIVYLRPFEADGVEYVTSSTGHVRARPARRLLGETTYEQRLAHALRDVAPLLAIANPSEGSLPELGATRLPAAESEWQKRVADLTARAGSVIVHAGQTDGLAWELQHIVDLGMPERLIIALPWHARRGQPSPEERYAAFANRFGNVFPRGLPVRAGDSQFLFFDTDWTPRRSGDPGTMPGSAGDQRTLVLERLLSEFKISPFPFWLRAAAGASLVMLAVVAVATAVYAVLA